jgi:hypothetical protein
MKQTLKQITVCIFCMATIVMFSLIGCKKSGLNADAEEQKGFEEDIKAQLAKLPYRDKLPMQLLEEKIPVTTFLADDNGNPLPVTGSPNAIAAPCNFTTPAYCNLVQYARGYDCNATTAASDGGYFMDFTYELSWDNAPFTRTSKGYLKVYNTQTNALVVDFVTGLGGVVVTTLGPDAAVPGNTKYRVNFRIANPVPVEYINNTAGLYSVYTSALFTTTCANGTNYTVGSAPVTSAGFTGASGNNPCTRNDKIFCTVSSSGGANPSYSVSAACFTPLNFCTTYGNFTPPDVIQVEYSLTGGSPTSIWYHNLTGYNNNGTGFIPYNAPGSQGSFMSSPALPSGTYNIVYRYRNWKYNNAAWFSTFPYTPPTLSTACGNFGNMSAEPDLLGYSISGMTYVYYGNLIVP